MANNYDFNPFDFLFNQDEDSEYDVVFQAWDPDERRWVPLGKVKPISFEAQFQGHRFGTAAFMPIDRYITNEDRQFLKSMNIIW